MIHVRIVVVSGKFDVSLLWMWLPYCKVMCDTSKMLTESLNFQGRHGGAGIDVGRDSKFVVFVFQC
jgi:hypothetical protein